MMLYTVQHAATRSIAFVRTSKDTAIKDAQSLRKDNPRSHFMVYEFGEHRKASYQGVCVFHTKLDR